MDLKLPDPRILGNSARQLGSIGARILEDSMASTATTLRRLGEMAETTRSAARSAPAGGRVLTVPCCPPVEECPPQCLAEITRRAHAGEVVLVPFRIHNRSGAVKTWQVGLRPLVDQNQNPAPSQPTLDKTTVTVPPSQSVVVEMRIDLTEGYQAGTAYEATIVIREKEINQNVCFRLILDPLHAQEVVPYDEEDLKTHFLSWHYHFYCDEKVAPVGAAKDVTPQAAGRPAKASARKKAKARARKKKKG